jgi:PPP family 3-phenylpropionic acid transporter
MALLLGFGMGLPAVLGSALGGLVVEALGYRWLFAVFSIFAVASLVLYRANEQSLKSVR